MAKFTVVLLVNVTDPESASIGQVADAVEAALGYLDQVWPTSDVADVAVPPHRADTLLLSVQAAD